MAAIDLSAAKPRGRQVRIGDLYGKFTFASAVLFAVVEIAYFGAWKHPSFWLPSWDAIDAVIGRDFLNIWMGGRAAFAGGPAAWFDVDAYNAAIRALLAPNPLNDYRYYWSYPPDIELFTWPFGLMPYLMAYVSWSVLGIVAFVATAARVGGIERKNLPFLALAPAVAVTVFFGQNGLFTAALLIGGLAMLERKPILAGVLFGVLTLKPQLGILLPIVLLLRGRWRTIAAAAATAVVLIAVTALLYGPEIWIEYLRKVGAQQTWVLDHAGGNLVPSALYAARELGLSFPVAWTAQIVESALALAAVVWTFARRRDEVLSWALLSTAIFLFTPYSYCYDMVVLAWVAALLRQRNDNSAFDHCLILAVWVLPVAMMLVGVTLHVPLGIIVLPLFVARLVWRLARTPAMMESCVRHDEPAMLAHRG
ncbi:MAG: glycosyltransferase family 87 protein [Xanthobacteraceae bacterium]